MSRGYKENVVRAYFKEMKLPDCEFEYRFHPERKWRFDIAFPEYKVAVEVQGGIWIGGAHARGKFIMRDYEKLNEAQLIGWIVLQVQPKELCTERVADDIGTAIAIQKMRTGRMYELTPYGGIYNGRSEDEN